jgi:hypothetical protein
MSSLLYQPKEQPTSDIEATFQSARTLLSQKKFHEARAAMDALLRRTDLQATQRKEATKMLQQAERRAKNAPVMIAATEEQEEETRRVLHAIIARPQQETIDESTNGLSLARAEKAGDLSIFGALQFLLRRNSLPPIRTSALQSWCDSVSPDRSLSAEEDGVAFFLAMLTVPAAHRTAVGQYLIIILGARGLLDDSQKEDWRMSLAPLPHITSHSCMSVE